MISTNCPHFFVALITLYCGCCVDIRQYIAFCKDIHISTALNIPNILTKIIYIKLTRTC